MSDRNIYDNIDALVSVINSKDWDNIPDDKKQEIATDFFEKYISTTKEWSLMSEDERLEFTSMYHDLLKTKSPQQPTKIQLPVDETTQRMIYRRALEDVKKAGSQQLDILPGEQTTIMPKYINDIIEQVKEKPIAKINLERAQQEWNINKDVGLSDIITSGIKSGLAGFTGGVSGVLSALNITPEYSHRRSKADLGYVSELMSGLERDISKADISPLKQTIYDILKDVVPSTTQSVTAMVTGGGLGGAPGALTMFGLSSGGAKYTQLSDREDISELKKLGISAITGASEALTELLPTESLFKAYGAKTIKGALWNAVKSLVTDAPGEVVNDLVENVTDNLMLPENKNKPFIEALEETIRNAPRTIATSVGQTLLVGLPAIAKNFKQELSGMGKDSQIQQKQDNLSGDGVKINQDSFVYDKDGNKINVRYEIVDAKDLVTSHTDDYNVNKEYPQELQPRDRSSASSQMQVETMANNLKPEMLGVSFDTGSGAPIVGQDNVVESGNGRVLAIRKAYKEGKAEGYISHIKEIAKAMGIDPQIIDNMEMPVLIKRRTSEVDRVKFVTDANAPQAMALTPVEKAFNDAKFINEEMLETGIDDNGNITNAMVEKFVNQLPATERTEYGFDKDTGLPTANTLTRIKNALLAYAYKNDKLVQKAIDLTNSNDKVLTGVLIKLAPIVAKLAGTKFDIGKHIVNAINIYNLAKQKGIKIEDIEKQNALFTEDKERFGKNDFAIAKIIEKHYKSPNHLYGALRNIAQNSLKKYKNSLISENNMFGEMEQLDISDNSEEQLFYDLTEEQRKEKDEVIEKLEKKEKEIKEAESKSEDVIKENIGVDTPELIRLAEELGIDTITVKNIVKKLGILGIFSPTNKEISLWSFIAGLPKIVAHVLSHEITHGLFQYIDESVREGAKALYTHLETFFETNKNIKINDRGLEENITDAIAYFIVAPLYLKEKYPQIYEAINRFVLNNIDNPYLKIIQYYKELSMDKQELHKERLEAISNSFEEGREKITEALNEYGKRMSLITWLKTHFSNTVYKIIDNIYKAAELEKERLEKIVRGFDAQKVKSRILELGKKATMGVGLTQAEHAELERLKVVDAHFERISKINEAIKNRDNIKRAIKGLFSWSTFIGNEVVLFIKTRNALFKKYNFTEEDKKNYSLFIFLNRVIENTEAREKLKEKLEEKLKQKKEELENVKKQDKPVKKKINELTKEIKQIEETLTKKARPLLNPYGFTKQTAQETLDALREKVGEEKYQLFEDIAENDATIWREHVLSALYESGVIDKELYKQFMDSKYYVPFSVLGHIIRNAREKGFPTSMMKMFRDTGTVSAIGDPHLAKFARGGQLIRLAARNKMMVKLLVMLNEMGLVEPAKYNPETGQYIVKEGQTLFVWLNGKAKAFYVPKDIFQDITSQPYEFQALVKPLHVVMNIMKGLFTVFSPKWVVMNVMRDTLSVWLTSPNIKLIDVVREIVKALPDAFNYVFKGEISEEIMNMIKSHTVRLDSAFIGMSAEERARVEVGLVKEETHRLKTDIKALENLLNAIHKIMTKAKKIPDAIADFVQMLEIAHKIAGGRLLVNFDPDFLDMLSSDEKSAYVREIMGTPNNRVKGVYSSMLDFVFFFTNIAIRGLHAIVDAINYHHEYAKRLSGGDKIQYVKYTVKQNLIAWKITKGLVFPAIVAAMAYRSFFDSDEFKKRFGFNISDMFKAIPETDRISKFCIPFWYEKETKKAHYIRISIPMVFNSIYGMFYSLFTGELADTRRVKRLGENVNPVGSANPFFAIASDIMDILSKRPPVDFLEREWLSQSELDNITDPIVAKKVMKFWLLNRLGGATLFGYYRDPLLDNRSKLDKMFDMYGINMIKGIYEGSNVGVVQHLQRNVLEEYRREEGRIRIYIKDAIEKGLEGKPITEEHIKAIMAKPDYFKTQLENYYKRQIPDAYLSVLFNTAKTNKERIAILQHLLKEQQKAGGQ